MISILGQVEISVSYELEKLLAENASIINFNDGDTFYKLDMLILKENGKYILFNDNIDMIAYLKRKK